MDQLVVFNRAVELYLSFSSEYGGKKKKITG